MFPTKVGHTGYNPDSSRVTLSPLLCALASLAGGSWHSCQALSRVGCRVAWRWQINNGHTARTKCPVLPPASENEEQWDFVYSRLLRDVSKHRAGSMKQINLALLETDQPQRILFAGTNGDVRYLQRVQQLTEESKI